jgi:hypothetical protein
MTRMSTVSTWSSVVCAVAITAFRAPASSRNTAHRAARQALSVGAAGRTRRRTTASPSAPVRRSTNAAERVAAGPVP